MKKIIFIMALVLPVSLILSASLLIGFDLPKDNVYTIDAKQLDQTRGIILGDDEGAYDLEVQYRYQPLEPDGAALTAQVSFTFPKELAPEELEITSGYTVFNQKPISLIAKRLGQRAETAVLDQDTFCLEPEYDDYSTFGEAGLSGVGTIVYPDLYPYRYTYMDLPVQVRFVRYGQTYRLETNIRVTFE